MCTDMNMELTGTERRYLLKKVKADIQSGNATTVAKLTMLYEIEKKLTVQQPNTPEVSKEWSDGKVMQFVNWYIEVNKLPSRYALENQFIIDSFKKGDDAKAWHTK